MSIQTFGLAAFRRSVAKGIRLAEEAEDYVRTSELLQIANPASLGVVCFRFNPRDSGYSHEYLEQINKKVAKGLTFSEDGFQELKGLFDLTLDNLRIGQTI